MKRYFLNNSRTVKTLTANESHIQEGASCSISFLLKTLVYLIFYNTIELYENIDFYVINDFS